MSTRFLRCKSHNFKFPSFGPSVRKQNFYKPNPKGGHIFYISFTDVYVFNVYFESCTYYKSDIYVLTTILIRVHT